MPVKSGAAQCFVRFTLDNRRAGSQQILRFRATTTGVIGCRDLSDRPFSKAVNRPSISMAVQRRSRD